MGNMKTGIECIRNNVLETRVLETMVTTVITSATIWHFRIDDKNSENQGFPSEGELGGSPLLPPKLANPHPHTIF